jgi:hypothetical protein
MNYQHDFQHGFFTRPDIVTAPLYVITPIFNPVRFRQRWKLYEDFERYVLMNDQAVLVTIECSFGNREQVLKTQPDAKHIYIHVTTKNEIWIKENLINLAIQRLPEDWQYCAWVDADIRFARPDWVGETIQQLQHYDLVQMFSEAIDLNPNYTTGPSRHKGFAYCYKNDANPGKSYSSWHPGFAWAATKHYINTVGQLIECSILGAGDRNMATSVIGRLEDSIPTGLKSSYVDKLKIWQERATAINKNIGFVEGTLWHYWHGTKANRKYRERWQILIENQYCPDTDLKKDWQGLWQLTTKNIKLRDQIRQYFRERNEDSIDI